MANGVADSGGFVCRQVDTEADRRSCTTTVRYGSRPGAVAEEGGASRGEGGEAAGSARGLWPARGAPASTDPARWLLWLVNRAEAPMCGSLACSS